MIPGVVASSRTAAAAPAYLLADDWTGTNGAPWNANKWPFQRNGTVDIQSNAGRLTAGGRPLAVSVITATDFEMLVKASWNTLSGINPEICWRIANGSASSDPSAGYLIQMSGSTVTMYNFGYSTIASAGSSGLNVNDSFWFRINVVGTTFKVRWWPVGGTEPGTWQITGTHSTHPGGRFGFTSYGSNAVTFDDLQITDLSGTTGHIAAKWYAINGGDVQISASAFNASDFTVTGWLRMDAAPPSDSTVGFYFDASGGSLYYMLAVNSSRVVKLLRSSGGDHTTGTTMTLGVWYFFAVSYVASTGVSTIRIAPTGGAVTTETTTTGPGAPASNTLHVNNTYGGVADVKLWTTALSAGEIDTERTKWAAQKTSGLWAEYRMDAEPFYTDTSGNARHMAHASGLPYRVQGPSEPT